MIPLRYAVLDDDDQRAIAERIVELQLGRTLAYDLDLSTAANLRRATEAQAEQDVLEEPFRARHHHRLGGGKRWFDADAALLDEAQFLRLFDGETALAGDILLAQVEVWQMSAVFEALWDLTPGEVRFATDWWQSLTTMEYGDFGGALWRMQRFHDDVVDRLTEVLEDPSLGSSADAEVERAEIDTMLALFRGRSALLEQHEGLERIFAAEDLDRRTEVVTGIVVPTQTVQRAAQGVGRLAALVRKSLSRGGSDRDHTPGPEDELHA